jgi:hypothetical protein
MLSFNMRVSCRVFSQFMHLRHIINTQNVPIVLCWIPEFDFDIMICKGSTDLSEGARD